MTPLLPSVFILIPWCFYIFCNSTVSIKVTSGLGLQFIVEAVPHPQCSSACPFPVFVVLLITFYSVKAVFILSCNLKSFYFYNSTLF